MPPNLSDEDQADFLFNIYFGYQDSQENQKEEWAEYIQNVPWWLNSFIIHVNEDN